MQYRTLRSQNTKTSDLCFPKFIETLDLHDQNNFSTRNYRLLIRDGLDISVSACKGNVSVNAT